MMAQFFSISLTLFFIMDALGIIPTYLFLVKKFPPQKQRAVMIRELIFALIIMLIFHYLGQTLLTLLNLNVTTVQISGGIILFLISVRLIFSQEDEPGKAWESETAPFIVPIATPLIAGPSLLAVIMIYAQKEEDLVVLLAILAAWALTALVLLCSKPIYKLVREKGLMACQRLMGMVVTLIAVQMLLQGIRALIEGSAP